MAEFVGAVQEAIAGKVLEREPDLRTVGERQLAGLDVDQIALLTTGLRRIKTNLKTELNGGA